MLTFWLICTFMLLIALTMVIVPVLRPKVTTSVSTFDASVATHRQLMRSLELQHNNGVLDSEGYQQAREEVEYSLLEETQEQGFDSKPTPLMASKLTAAVLLILVPAFSIGLYAFLGNYPVLKILDDPKAIQTLREQHPPRDEDLARQVTNLKRVVRREPTDIAAWDALAIGQIALEKYIDAANTLDHLIRTFGETQERLVNYAEASSIAHKMKFSPLARQRLERALELEPGHPKSLMMGALAALHSGEKNLALKRWKKLIVKLKPDTDSARLIRMLITRTEGGLSTAQVTPDTTKNKSVIPNAQINVSLSLSPTLQEKVTGQERVFVFARAVGGPPMPVAVKVLNVTELPISILLNDSTSMPSGPRLSSVEQVQVGARISFSGSATGTAGDLEGYSGPLRTQDNPSVNLVIDRVRP